MPLEWADNYAGQFAGGRDAQREDIFARQIQRPIEVVQIDVGDDDQSHLIDPARVAMVAVSLQ